MRIAWISLLLKVNFHNYVLQPCYSHDCGDLLVKDDSFEWKGPKPDVGEGARKWVLCHKPFSSPGAAILLICAWDRDLWSASNTESPRLRFIVKSEKSDWLKNTEPVICACSVIGIGQRSRSLVQTRRIAASGDANGHKQYSKTYWQKIHFILVVVTNSDYQFKL